MGPERLEVVASRFDVFFVRLDKIDEATRVHVLALLAELFAP